MNGAAEKSCPPRDVVTEVTGARGCSCTVVANQFPDDPGGWTIDLFGLFPGQKHETRAFIRRFTLTAPSGVNPPTRVIASVTMAGARGFYATVMSGPGPTDPITVALYGSDVTALGVVNVAP